MYAIYGNIYHQYTPFMSAYIPAPAGSYGLYFELVRSRYKPKKTPEGAVFARAGLTDPFARSNLVLWLRGGFVSHGREDPQ